MNYLIICISLYLIIDSKKAMHMLQQNWYNEGNRYLNWIKDNLKQIFNLNRFIFLLIPFIGLLSNTLLFCSVLIIYLFNTILILINYKKEQKKKPLVFTSRVKRLYITTILFYTLYFILVYKFINNNVLIYLFLGILAFLNYFVVFITNILNKPIEKLVYLYYKTKAVNKLKQFSNMEVIGVTGSYGKTSTKNIINDILNVKYIAMPTPQNFNTNYGLIKTINEYMDKYNDYFIAEMGATKTGSILSRTKLVHPKYGVLTKIGSAHLDTFGSIENIIKTKFELIEALPKDGIAFLNIDDEYQKNYKLRNKVKIVWYGLNDKADIYAKNIKYSNKGLTFDVYFKDKNIKFTVNTCLLGEANVYNILAGIAVANELGLGIEEIKTGVSLITPIEHRLQLKRIGCINYIDDAYNSNPVGAKMALDTLNLMPGKKIVITPGMIELSDKEYEYNYKFGRQIAKVADLTILVGKKQTVAIKDGLLKEKYPDKKLIIVNDVKEAIAIANNKFNEETYILLENDLPDMFNEK